ncbi:hypothetical protein [Sphingomonas rosea]|uniref:hypothetical protein n=1 Tax=Sphingomonas rosea TaxID=335605 RepID=UPI0031D4D52A
MIFAVQQRRALHEADGNEKEAALFDRYSDSLWEALAISQGAKREAKNLKRIRADTLGLTDPWLLENLLPFPRSRVAYREMTKLAGRVCRAEQGLSPKRLWGIIG